MATDNSVPLTPSQERRLREALREANNLAFGYATAVIIAAPPSVGGEVNHGSGIIIHLPEGHFLLTAEHVVRSWYTRYPKEPAVLLHMKHPDGWGQFKAQDRLVLYDKTADVAALRLTEEEAKAGGTYIYEPGEWPPPPPKKDELVHVVGFPKEGRIKLGPKKFEFRSLNLAAPVTHIADPNFKCQLDRSQLVNVGDEATGPLPSLFDGMSGGPAMAMRGLVPVLLGTVSEHHPDLDILIVGRWSRIPRERFAGG
jgi:hypothetical protein